MSTPDINAGAWYLQAVGEREWNVCEPVSGEVKATITASGDAAAAAAGALPYVYFSIATVIVLTLQVTLISWCSLTASRRIHSDMARRVIRAPMWWFEKTPAGRILNRFSSDVETIDQDLMDTMSIFLRRLCSE